MSQKPRIEPEINVPEDVTEQMAENLAEHEANEVSLEDLVPGIEAEIARQGGEEHADEAELLVARFAELEAERDAFKDKWARALAEAENVRRRAERDKADAQAYGGTKLARDMLNVYDNLERALKAADETLREEHGSFLEGVELTQRELINAFSKHKIATITPEVGEKFDPNRHQAMFEAPIPGAETGTVIECMQDGFVISDRLLRPALVGVAKAVVEAGPADDETAPDA
ncbi:MAG: nucleotide exchange factor GrpE [Paracoccaceae bacterium]